MSSFLFLKNFPTFIEKGIEVKPLLDSNIFNHEFDYDDWPSTHNNQSEELRPFNENLFQLREHYKTVFPEKEFNSIDDQNKEKDKQVQGGISSFFSKGEKNTTNKVYKIKYALNLLPSIGTYINKERDLYT